jgi:hypothetical protein
MTLSTPKLLILAAVLALLAFVVPAQLGVFLFLAAIGVVVYAYFRPPNRWDDPR